MRTYHLLLRGTALTQAAGDALPHFNHEIAPDNLIATICDASLGGVLKRSARDTAILAGLVGFCTRCQAYGDATRMLSDGTLR